MSPSELSAQNEAAYLREYAAYLKGEDMTGAACVAVISRWRNIRPKAVRMGMILFRAKGLVANETIIARLWDDDAPMTAENCIRVYGTQLRKILGKDGIESIYGQGMRLSSSGYKKMKFLLDAAESEVSR